MNFTKLEIHLGCESLLTAPLAVFEHIRITDKNGCTCIQQVSCSLAFEQIRITDEK